ncbi:hypothetical protein J3R83DRAFT_5025 [Lanmaoa asiatica]|nr:hypothetical protein J3R83DRAFT_5025 [Lanmaoa asiatica]
MLESNTEPKFQATSPCRLNPVTSLNTSRYANSGCVQLCPQVINRGPASSSRSVQALRSSILRISSDTSTKTSTSSASKWQRFVHPEGQPYFVLTSKFNFAVVTEANVEDVETEGRILDCVEVANKELQSHNIKVPLRCELFLELEDDHATCNYYFVDHIEKGLFWLEDLSTEFLDIPGAVSPSHLERALERLYWVHVEFFPMHHDSHEQEFSQIINDLYNIISHGQADRLTSRTSTFPYTAETCNQFLKLLSRKRVRLAICKRLHGNKHSFAVNQRFVTFYGQQPAQLDRLQEMCPADVVEHKWLSTLANLLMWGVPRHYNSLLVDLYANEQVYADQWTHFMSNCLADWTSSFSWSSTIIIIASASCLHLRHRPFAESSAAVGVRRFPNFGLFSALTVLFQARYLRFAKWNTIGFLPSSVVFGLPRASYLWGVGLLTAQLLFIASRSVNRLVALLAACVIAAILMFMLCVIHPEDASIASLTESFTSLCMPHLYTLDAREGELMV